MVERIQGQALQEIMRVIYSICIYHVTAYTNLVYIVVESFSVPHVGTLGQCNITIKRL